MTASASGRPDRVHWQGEPLAAWEASWGIPRLEAWSALPSTNDRARVLAREGAPPWTVVVADRQEAGRGRGGRAWQSEAGSGLWASFLLRARSPATAGLLPLLAGLAVAEAVESLGAEAGSVGLKWPNDVWIGGRKVAGILCEGVGEVLVAGIGVNLRAPARGWSDSHAATAGALEPLTGRPWSEGRLLGAIVSELRILWDAAPVRLDGVLARAWSARDILRDEPVRIGAVEGVGRGIAPDGALLVERADGSRVPVRVGSVEWRGRSSGPGAA